MAYRMRKDPQGHTLKNGECYRKDGRYSYSWTNPRGERKTIYSTNLQALRKREKQLIYDLEDGIDPLAANVVTVNQLWDKYIKQKYDLAKFLRLMFLVPPNAKTSNRIIPTHGIEKSSSYPK